MSNYNDRTAEGTGHITSDSLAADSLRDNPSQGFASNERFERGPAPSSVPSKSTTANITDTSAAYELDPAKQRQDRLTEDDLRGTYRTPAQEPGLDKFGDSTYSEQSSGSRPYDTTTGGPQESLGDAPSAYQAGQADEQSKPKGKNLQEVSSFGSEEDAPNASMQYGNDIGGRNDPGRRAEQAFANRNALSGADAGYPGAGKQGADVNQGGFENLDSDRQA